MNGLRLTTRGWIVVWCLFCIATIGLMIFVDAYVMDLTPTQAEMESLR